MRSARTRTTARHRTRHALAPLPGRPARRYAAVPRRWTARARWCASPASCSRPPACACRWARCARSRCQRPAAGARRGGRLHRRPRLPDAHRRRARPVQRRARGAAPGAADARRASARDNHPWRRSEDRGLHLPMGDGLLGRVVDAHGEPMDRLGPLQHARARADDAPPDQRDGPRPGAPAAGHRRARDQRAAHRRPRPAHRPVRRHRRRQVGAAGHDGALHRGRRDRRRPDRRARPRGQGIHRGHPRATKGCARSVVVAAPADAPPLVRMQGANYATAIAEHFRDRASTCCC